MKCILCYIVLQQSGSILAKIIMGCFHNAKKKKAGISAFKT